MKKSICFSCDHLNKSGFVTHTQTDGSIITSQNLKCNFLNASLNNSSPHSEIKCSHFLISESASPEEKFNSL